MKFYSRDVTEDSVFKIFCFKLKNKSDKDGFKPSLKFMPSDITLTKLQA